MGLFSVYCELSRITITSGDRCGVGFLDSTNRGESGGLTLLCPPIWGIYNDYGGIEDIEESPFTCILEQVYGKSIEDFFESCYEGEQKGVQYCWVNRDVYEGMSKYHPQDFRRADNIDTGNSTILKFLGMVKLEGERKDIEPQYAGMKDLPSNVTRYKQVWEGHGVRVYSDGTWLDAPYHHSVQLQHLRIPFPDDFVTSENQNLFHHFKDARSRADVCGLFEAFGMTGHTFRADFEYESFMGEVYAELDKEMPKRRNRGILYRILSLIYKELEDDAVAQALADLLTVTLNGMYYSFSWKPLQSYVTPQCGEHAHHQVFLEMFCRINKSHIINHES